GEPERAVPIARRAVVEREQTCGPSDAVVVEATEGEHAAVVEANGGVSRPAERESGGDIRPGFGDRIEDLGGGVELIEILALERSAEDEDPAVLERRRGVARARRDHGA